MARTPTPDTLKTLLAPLSDAAVRAVRDAAGNLSNIINATFQVQ